MNFVNTDSLGSIFTQKSQPSKFSSYHQEPILRSVGLNSLNLEELRENNYNDSNLLNKFLEDNKMKMKRQNAQSHSPSIFSVLKSTDNVRNILDAVR